MSRLCQPGESEGGPPGCAHPRQSRSACSLDGRRKQTAVLRQPRKAGAHTPFPQRLAVPGLRGPARWAKRIYKGTTTLDRPPPSGQDTSPRAGREPPEGGQEGAQGKIFKGKAASNPNMC